MEYTTRELTPEEGQELTKDLQEVLKKHGAEMGVISSIQLLKRVEPPTPSPYEHGDKPDTTEEAPKTD